LEGRTETFSQGYSRRGRRARVFCEDFCCRVVARLLLSAFCGTKNLAPDSPRDTGRTNSSERRKDVS